jgi:hypothetical protein
MGTIQTTHHPGSKGAILSLAVTHSSMYSSSMVTPSKKAIFSSNGAIDGWSERLLLYFSNPYSGNRLFTLFACNTPAFVSH